MDFDNVSRSYITHDSHIETISFQFLSGIGSSQVHGQGKEEEQHGSGSEYDGSTATTEKAIAISNFTTIVPLYHSNVATVAYSTITAHSIARVVSSTGSEASKTTPVQFDQGLDSSGRFSFGREGDGIDGTVPATSPSSATATTATTAPAGANEATEAEAKAAATGGAEHQWQ